MAVDNGRVNLHPLMMKVLLISPPDIQFQFAIIPDFLRQADFASRLPPIGILYIAAHLMKYTDHEVAVLDAHLDDLNHDDMEDYIRNYKPDIVGVAAYTSAFLDTIEIARRTKRVDSDIFVVIGGPHARVFPAETANLPEVDAVVPGEGEEVMTELVEALAQGTPIKAIPGLYFRGNDGEVVATPERPPIADLDSLPFPARSLTPTSKYKIVTDKNTPSTSIISSRGCRSKCTFCDVPFKSIRARSPSNVVDEIAECIQMGYKGINFYDDSFNFSEARVEEICREIIDRGVVVPFSVRGRVDKINANLLKLMKEAGCTRINFGIEAGDDKILKAVKKGITVDMVRRAVALTKDAGIEVVGYFLIGVPGQTVEEVHKTIDFAIELDPDYAQLNTTFLLPGTEMYYDAIKAGAFENDFLLEFAKNPAPSDIISYWENPLSFETTSSLTKLAYKRFYLRPKYILKQLKKLGSFQEFVRKLSMAFYVITYSLLPKKAFKPSHFSRKNTDTAI